jgi:hypothetical protein
MKSFIALIVMIVGGLVASSRAQQVAENAGGSSCQFSEIYRAAGWEVPGLPAATISAARASVWKMPGVFVTALKPGDREASILSVSCPGHVKGRLVIADQPVSIWEIRQYDVGGRVFAYGISYGYEAVENGRRIQMGAASSEIFYDTDGRGRFTLRKYARPPMLPEFVPDWATKAADVR